MDEDSELIRRYTRENAEEAFAALVRRHVDLVFSIARIPNLARNGQVRDVEGIDENTIFAVRTWMKEDPQSAIRWLGSIPPEGNQRMHMIEAFIAIELGSDPEIAFLLANSIGNESARVRRLKDVVTIWAPVDSASAATAVRTADVPEKARVLLLREVERSSRPR